MGKKGDNEFYKKDLTVVSNISEMEFTAGYSVSGNADAYFPETVGRGACITSALAVNGGETIDFVSNLEEVFGSTNLSFAVLEFSEAPLSKDTLSTTESVSKMAVGKQWSTTAHTLQANTRYVLIAFKNGDGSVDFTSEQAGKLNQCLTISTGSNNENPPVGGGDSGEEPDSGNESDGTTTTFSGKTLTIVEDFSEVNFIQGFSMGSEGTSFTPTEARALSQTELLKVDGTKRRLSLDLTKLSIGANLQYTVHQYTGLPLDKTTHLNGTGAGTWTQEEIVLSSDTQYIIIIFKNNTQGAKSFTSEDVALLNQCVVFNEIDAVEGIDYYGTPMEAVSSISEMTFDPNYAPPGYASEPFKQANVAGRATCINAVLEVSGGETIGFVENLEEVFGSTALSFAVLEFTAAPLSNETMSFPNAKLNSATEAEKAACAGAWLTANHTLQSNTRYVMIAFKNGDGKTDFTTEQLAVLNQCLQIVSEQ